MNDGLQIAEAVEQLRRAAEALQDALERDRDDRLLVRFRTAARLLDTSENTLRAWIRKGLIRQTKISGNTYLARQDLRAFIERHRVPEESA